jgi:hypothetical protein
MILQLDYGYKLVTYSFKFNRRCLHEESFCDLVRLVWSNHQKAEGYGAQSRLTRNISMLKARVKMCLVEKKKELLAFESLETEITQLTKKFLESDHYHEIRTLLKSL